MGPDELFSLDILPLFGLENAPAGEQEQFLAHISQLILTEVVKKIEARLSPEDYQEFVRLFKKDMPRQEQSCFLQQHVPDFEELLLAATLSFKKRMLEDSNKL